MRLRHAELIRLNNTIADLYERAWVDGYLIGAAKAIHHLIGGTVACTMMRREGGGMVSGVSESEIGEKIYSIPSALLFTHPLMGRRTEVTSLSNVLSQERWHRSEVYQAIGCFLQNEDELGIDIALGGKATFSLCLMRESRGFRSEDEQMVSLMLPHLRAISRRTPPVAKLPTPAALSRREHEVLSWLAEGKTNDELACILGISPKTVKRHLENIYQKLGVENRFAAMSVVFSKNLGAADPLKREEGLSLMHSILRRRTE